MDKDKGGIVVVFMVLMTIGMVVLSATLYNLGLAEGQLRKLEAYEKIYMPNPANVYPAAVDGVYTNDTIGGE